MFLVMLYIMFEYENTLSFILCLSKGCKRRMFFVMFFVGAHENASNSQ